MYNIEKEQSDLEDLLVSQLPEAKIDLHVTHMKFYQKEVPPKTWTWIPTAEQKQMTEDNYLLQHISILESEK